jgi:dihydrofolate reductase
MARLVVFNSVSLDGFFTGKDGDISWMMAPDEELDALAESNLGPGGMMVFGRITYEMMASYWPTAQALQDDPLVAQWMNARPKVVFSRTLDGVSWENSTLVKGELAATVRELKQRTGGDIMLFGSGSLVAQLTDAGLIDEYQFVLRPIAIGEGRTMFEGITEPLSLKLIDSQIFRSGIVVLRYEPVLLRP